MSSKRTMLALPLLTSLALIGGVTSAVGLDAPKAPVVTASAPQEKPVTGLIVKTVDSATELPEVAQTLAGELPSGVEVVDTTDGSAAVGLISLDQSISSSQASDAIEALEANPDVEWAVPNFWNYPSATANDPYYTNNSLWNLNGTWGVQANSAWDVTTGSSAVRVAVVDTGVRLDHPDLAPNLVPGRDFVDDEYSCYSDGSCYYHGTYLNAGDGNGWDSDPSDPGDWRTANFCYSGSNAAQSSWHGTHVAGTIAAVRNNSIGVAGVAPNVKIQPVRVLGKCGGSSWDIAMGMLWAAGENVYKYDRNYGNFGTNPTPAKVINLSLGGARSTDAQAAESCRFYSWAANIARGRGAILLAAAGNDGIVFNRNTPAACAGFVSVAATKSDGARSSFSNYGPNIDVAAPGGGGSAGTNIMSTINAGTQGPSSNTYGAMAGTSMATPAVAGTAALAYSLGITNPDVVERVLKATARRSSCTAEVCGAGIVSANNVVRAKAPTAAPKISGSARPGTWLKATNGTWRNTTAIKLTWYSGSKVVGTGPSYKVKPTDGGQRIRVRATATDGLAAIFIDSTVTAAKNSSKTSISIPSKVKKSKNPYLKVTVKSALRPTGTIQVYDGKKRISIKSLKAGNYGKLKIKLPKLKKGTHKIKVVYVGSSQVAKSTSSTKTVKSR